MRLIDINKQNTTFKGSLGAKTVRGIESAVYTTGKLALIATGTAKGQPELGVILAALSDFAEASLRSIFSEVKPDIKLKLVLSRLTKHDLSNRFYLKNLKLLKAETIRNPINIFALSRYRRLNKLEKRFDIKF